MVYNTWIESMRYSRNVGNALKPNIPWFFNTTASWRISV